MRFFFGVIDRSTGRRHVVTGMATPTIEDLSVMDDVRGDELEEDCDWGEDATEHARLMLAANIMKYMPWPGVTDRAIKDYADDVVMKMKSGEKWVLSLEEIQKWAVSHYQVVQ